MKYIRTLIVEDEPIARAALRRLVEEEKDIALVAECPDGLTALTAIRQHRPELVFLDVQLPGLNGLDLLQALDGDMPPAVIFVTAHSRYALSAFASHATDFLLKPFTPERFRESLKRARLRLRDRLPIENSLSTLAKNTRPRGTPPSVLSLKVGKRFVLIRADAIEAIVANESSSVLHTTEGNHRTRLSLAALEKKLPPGKLVRINRSTLVNAEHVKDLVHKEHGDGLLRLDNGQEFPLARRYRKQWAVLMDPSLKTGGK
jgi:two-component system LytT family response regulator